MNITFNGAALNVTGSKHLIETEDGFRILLDCGLHQGRRQETAILNKTLPFDPKSIDAVLLSHGHADHCGMIPVLVKQGFRGKVYATPATIDVAECIMRDSASIQEQDAIYINEHLAPNQEPVEPLYTKDDVEAAMPFFAPVPYFLHTKQWTKLTDTVRFKFLDAGHILGSSITVLQITEKGETKTLVYTGDLGPARVPILRAPERVEESVDVLLSECTYGNKNHKPLEKATEDLIHIINHAITYKSKIVVPAFSLGRTQELVYILHKLTDDKKIPRIPIYIDSPLAADLTEVFSKHTEEFNDQEWQDFGKRGEVPLIFRNLIYTHSIEESKKLNSANGPLMIISASGMCEGGRILHHLKHNIEDKNTIVLITGYQAEGTLGRKLLEGISPVRIFGQQYTVRANIVVFNEFSAHADQNMLLQYIHTIPNLKKIFLVHTESRQAEKFNELLHHELPKIAVEIPTSGQKFEL